jgi:hypothetical protein
MSKSRKVKIAVGVVVIGSFLGLLGWRLTQPRMRFATLAEVEAVVDKRLLERLPQSQPGKQEKLDELLKQYKDTTPPRDSKSAEYRRWASDGYANNRLLIHQITALFESGPVQPPKRSADQFFNFSGIKQLGKYCAGAAEDDLSQGRPGEAIAKLKDGYRLTEGFLGNSQTIIEYLVGLALVAIMDVTTSRIAEAGLSASQLRELLRFVTSLDPDRSIVRRSVIGDFQGYTLPAVPELTYPDAEELAAGVPFFPDEDPEPFVGQYDAIESAQIASKVAASTLDNLPKPYGKIDRSIEVYQSTLAKGLPQENYTHLSDGPEKAARKVWYRVQMNNTPNSIGRQLYADWSIGASLCFGVARASTARELLRASLALQVYKRERGSYPASLDRLVQAGILSGLPIDHMTGKPVKYDAAKRVVYGVGENLVDDGGANNAGKLPTAKENKDWTYRLP